MIILDDILAFGKCIIDFLLFFWFSKQFFSHRWDKHIFFPYVILVSLATFLCFTNYLHRPQLNTIAALTCALFINFFLFKGHKVAQLLCSIVEVLIIVICEFIPISIYSLIARSDISIITNETIKNAGFNLIGTGIFIIIIMLTRYIILKRKNLNKNISISENIATVIVPIVSIFIIYYILDIHSMIPSEKNDWQSISAFLGILLMNIVVIAGDNNLRKRYQLQRDLDELNRLKHLNKVVIDQQDQFINELKGFAHDFTKQIRGIECILKEEGANSIGNEFSIYENEMYKNIEEAYRFVFIPTVGLRAILTQAQLRCNSFNITFDVDIQYADFSFVKFPDLYSLFENPLENAINACNEITSENPPKKIKIVILRKKNFIWIELKNTKENPIIIKNGIIETTKSNSAWHGMGIKNMKRAIQRYDGNLNIDYTENEFFITMVLPVPKNTP